MSGLNQGGSDRESENPKRWKFDPLVSSGPQKGELFAEAIKILLPDEFLNYALSNPDPQCYRIGWIANEVPTIELAVRRNEWKKIAENREILICGQGIAEKSEPFKKLAWVFQYRIINEIKVEVTQQWPSAIGSFSLRVRPPVSAAKIQRTLLALAIEFEKAGFVCNNPIDFDYRGAIEEDRFGYDKRFFAGDELPSPEQEERPILDVTQAKQAIAQILNKNS